MHVADDFRHRRAVGGPPLADKKGDQATIAGVEVEMDLLRHIQIRLLEDERHTEDALVEVDRVLPVRADQGDVVHAGCRNLHRIIHLERPSPPALALTPQPPPASRVPGSSKRRGGSPPCAAFSLLPAPRGGGLGMRGYCGSPPGFCGQPGRNEHDRLSSPDGARRNDSEANHRAQRLPPLHGVEPLLGFFQRDDSGHHPIQIEPALLIPLRQQREVPRRQTVAIP